eukprot:5069992-Amphidinium_carterae.1
MGAQRQVRHAAVPPCGTVHPLEILWLRSPQDVVGCSTSTGALHAKRFLWGFDDGLRESVT